MSKTIPLIRAGALIPMTHWMTANHRPLERRLQEVDLGYVPFIDPNQPIPLRNTARFFANAARNEGPDIGCRVVSETSIQELALIGSVALGAPTPRAALQRISTAIPFHCSHETVTVQKTDKGIQVGEGWAIHFDDLTLHTIQQFFASIIRLMCSLTNATKPLLRRVEIVPHPEHGVAHLRKWFCIPPVAADTRFLKITIDTAVGDRRYLQVARDRTGGLISPSIERLTGDGTLAGSAKKVLAVQLSDGTPTIDRLAASTGRSRRTLQRQLAAEGTNFSDLLEEVRQALAIRQLENETGSIDDVAANLGYARQSTLTRAVRRWTGRTPSSFRNTGA